MSNPYTGWHAVELFDELIIARLRQQKYASERDFKEGSVSEEVLAAELENLQLIKSALSDSLKG